MRPSSRSTLTSIRLARGSSRGGRGWQGGSGTARNASRQRGSPATQFPRRCAFDLARATCCAPRGYASSDAVLRASRRAGNDRLSSATLARTTSAEPGLAGADPGTTDLRTTDLGDHRPQDRPRRPRRVPVRGLSTDGPGRPGPEKSTPTRYAASARTASSAINPWACTCTRSRICVLTAPESFPELSQYPTRAVSSAPARHRRQGRRPAPAHAGRARTMPPRR